MSTPWPVLSILVAYLLFVLKFGPKMMENRQPFKIKRIIMVYNIAQTIYNIFIVSEVSVIHFNRNIYHKRINKILNKYTHVKSY